MAKTGPVRVIYTCYGGTHSSPVAAAIHLGHLPRRRIPTAGQIMAVPLYDKIDGKSRGELFLAGKDRLGNEVYVLGRGRESASTVARLIEGGLKLAGADVSWVLADTLPCVNGLMRLGGFLSRNVGLVTVGRPAVLLGTRLAYPRLVRLVEDVERRIQAGFAGPVI
ncbi:MAG: DUF3189 family protein [Firmicutes bacterium]|nr:DUF3189 family protein [Bacillota bacterium]